MGGKLKLSASRFFSCLLLGSALFISNLYADDTTLPNGLSFAGLVGEKWYIYAINDGELKQLSTIENPRTFSHHASTNKIAYIGSDSVLRLQNFSNRSDLGVNTLEGSRYTQPSFSHDGEWLLAVELPEGKSRRTNIVGFDTNSGDRHVFVQKRTAQFEPYMDSEKYLHYTTATCVDDCGGMIWELWRRDMQTGKQLQLTLMNAVANQPHVHGEKIYFSSNSDSGRFHIWSVKDTPGAEPRQMTTGDVRDSDPTTDKNGKLYFLRKVLGTTTVMMMQGDGPITLQGLEKFKDIRNLEISR